MNVRVLTTALIFSIAAHLGGCTTTSPLPASVSQTPTGKKMAIVSTIRNEMQVKRIGATIFGNKETTIPVSEWKIDRVTAERVASHAEKRGYEVIILDDPAVKA